MLAQSVRGLDHVQKWMQSVITHPDGIAAGIESDAAQQQIEVSLDRIHDVIRPSRRQTSIQRLEVYGNAYYARLLECLREEFPALVHALGQEAFDAFAFSYLQRYPPGSYTLATLGRSFPQYLAETRPPDSMDADGKPAWPDFLIDLATVERTYSEVFDGPGIEGGEILRLDDLAGITPERWSEARLVPVPCLRLLSLRFPVQEYISAVRRDTEPVIPQPSPTHLVVNRRAYVVRHAAVSRAEYNLLRTLIGGATVGAALLEVADSPVEVADSPDVQIDTLASDLQQWFRTWAAAPYFQAVALAD